MGSPVLCRLYPQAPVVPNGVPCSPYDRLCAFQYRTITFDSRRYTTNVIILPKYFESMIGGADQLITIQLRFRDEPDIPVRA
jgi:hypothetical protein